MLVINGFREVCRLGEQKNNIYNKRQPKFKSQSSVIHEEIRGIEDIYE